jgi:hypothetical protein
MHGMKVKNASKCLGLCLEIADLNKIKQISYDCNNGSILVTLPRDWSGWVLKLANLNHLMGIKNVWSRTSTNACNFPTNVRTE